MAAVPITRLSASFTPVISPTNRFLEAAIYIMTVSKKTYKKRHMLSDVIKTWNIRN